MIKYSLGTKQTDAIYTESDYYFYKNNPLIQACPNSFTKNEIQKLLCEDKNCPNINIFSYVSNEMVSSLKRGYIERNAFIKNNEPLSESITGFSIIDDLEPAGSIDIDKLLQLFPKMITHKQYQKEDFNYNQMVWAKVKIENWDMKQFYLNFVKEFEHIIPEDEFKECLKCYKYEMFSQIVKIARLSSLGMLVIDGMGQTYNTSRRNMKMFMHFIACLINSIKVPVIMIAPMKVLNASSDGEWSALRIFGGFGCSSLSKLRDEISLE